MEPVWEMPQIFFMTNGTSYVKINTSYITAIEAEDGGSMKRRRRNKTLLKAFSLILSFTLFLTGIGITPSGGDTVKAADIISITDAEGLAKIGRDPNYPMDGDYRLAADIDLSGTASFTPIGGASGPEYALVSGDRVFSGTFDGAGHVIDGLTIQYNGSGNGQKTNASGLFAMIGSDSPSDFAEVKNIIFTNVSITHTLGLGDTAGTLAGDVNGYVKISNIAVLSGSIEIRYTNDGDLIGVGGIVGQTRTNSSAVQMSHLYNAASVTVDSQNLPPWERCGGIIGRIHQQGTIGSLSSCVNVGAVTFGGVNGYAINGYSSSIDAAANTANISNCYYIEGKGKDFGSSKGVSEEQLSSQATVNALGEEYWTLSNGKLIPIISEGKVVTPIPSPQFAQGDSASSVTQNFTLPLSFTSEDGEETISWTSANPGVISINSQTGEASVQGVLSDTSVTLTAVTSVSGRTKTITVTVRSQLKLSIDKEYAKPGVAMTASVQNAPAGTAFSYSWKSDKSTVSSTASYTPKTSDLNKLLTVSASLNGSPVGELKIYCSKLPVVYIDTADGHGITSKTDYKAAHMRVQGNDIFNSQTTTLYDGDTEIRGRGNSTWNTSFNKLPYKLKLGSKTDLFGFGNSKHWALLANYMDESLIRNTTSYDLAGKMGISPHLKSTHVELVLNGVYAGNYQLVGNVRIDSGRVEIFDWEDLPGDVAKAIGKKEGILGDARDAFEDYLNENMQWITSGSITYQNKTYKVSDYFTDFPTNEDGSLNVSGGFLFELDEYYDEVSKFRTDKGLPMMFKSPEFIQTNNTLMQSAKDFIQAVEDSVWSSDFYTVYDGGRKHYTDLVDLDSLVNYLIINEFYWNTETMKKSTFMYKDLDSKLVIGPLWDMDWTSNSRVSAGETNRPYDWMIKSCGAATETQRNSWYLALAKDPYFVQRMYECYTKNRQNFEDIVKRDGIIDQDIEYLRESVEANYNAGYMMNRYPFVDEAERLRTFLKTRLGWMDQQFASLQTLIGSLGLYKASGQVSVTADTSGSASTVYTASITNSSAKKAGFYINGILAGTADVSGSKAVLTASDEYLRKENGAVNIVQVRAMDASGALLQSGSINNYTSFTKDITADALTGTVTIRGNARVGSALKAEVTDSNYTGALSYQWFADGSAITGANADSYVLTEKEEGKRITVEVTCSIENGKLISKATEPVVKPDVKNDHILIHQVYGGGKNDGTPVSHSFIELYNPTDSAISLEGYSLGYLSGGKNGPAAEEVRLQLSGKEIPARTSYLIRCEAQDDSTPELITLRIEEFDQEWTQSIDNKRYRLVLYAGDQIIDGVSVNEGDVEGLALADGTISKQKAIRRKAFADTDNNMADFEVVSYQGADAATVEANRPRSLADGEWGAKEPPDPNDVELYGTLSIRGNAILGAILYADEATNNTGELSYQWNAGNSPIPGANGQFYTVGSPCLGKQISVTITSSKETGSMTATMDSSVREIEAQNSHLIIHQVYGGGGKGDTPISHSFIELYNPTPRDISLEGYSIEYESNGNTAKLLLSGTIPSGTSYLIQGAQEEDGGSVFTLPVPDCTWDMEIANKRYRIVLKNGDTQVDAVSVNEASAEGAPLVNPEGDEIISKNKSIRRISFIDTDDNAMDFEVLNYSKLPLELVSKVVPRCTADGAWGLTIKPIKPDEELVKRLTGAIAEAEGKDKGKYTEDSYAKLASELASAKDVLGRQDVTSEELQEALVNLQQAIAGLIERPVNPPAGNSDQNQTQNPGGSTEPVPEKKLPEKGSKVRVGKAWYQVTKSAESGGTVSYLKPAAKNYQNIKVPATVEIEGVAFKVTAISAKAMKGNKKLASVTVGKNVASIGVSAFEGCGKLKKITVKSAVLKKVGKNALKGVNNRCKIKVPKKMLKKYKDLWKKKGQKPGVTVVK